MAAEDADLDIFNLVQQLASLNWRNQSASPCQNHVNATVGNNSTTSSLSTKSTTSQRIAQDIVSSSSTKSFTAKHDKNVDSNHSLFTSPGRRIQPVSIPRKPPDIQNLALFPQLGESNTSTSTTSRLVLRNRKSENNAVDFELSPAELKIKKLENKLRGRGSLFGTQDTTPDDNKSLNGVKPFHTFDTPSSTTTVIPVRKIAITSSGISVKKAPRSAEIFSELSPQIVAEVDLLALKYSSQLDKNVCRSVLEELTFLLQLISSSRTLSNDEKTGLKNFGSHLGSVAQQVYFVIKVLLLQLDKFLFNVDPHLLLLLVEKYPHRIPKPLRKHFQTWAEKQIQRLQGLSTSSPEITHKPSEFHQCVTFHSETDGRSNFPCQGDFHAFCKQRDLFYSIKTQWAQKQLENQSSLANSFNSIPMNTKLSSKNAKKNIIEEDPLAANIAQLFHMNSSWANLSHFASLFTSQFLIDSIEDKQLKKSANCSTNIGEDEQMKNIKESNPDRFAKLNSRMSSSMSNEKPNEIEESDYLTFQKYFLKCAGSPAFNQHLIDRISYEIVQMEISLDTTTSLTLSDREVLIKKMILLSKLLGHLIFLPYSDDGPNPIQVVRVGPSLDKEALLSKQLELRKNHRSPINLMEILRNAIKKQRLIFTLPWVIEYLNAVDRVCLQLPTYTQVIRAVCAIYHTLLTIENFDDLKQETLKPFSYCITLTNKNCLRFYCGNFFTGEKFPVSFLYDKPATSDLYNLLEQMSLNNNCQSSVSSDEISTSVFQNHEDEISWDCIDAIGERMIKRYFTSMFVQMKHILHVGMQQQRQTEDSNIRTPLTVKHIRPIRADSQLKSEIRLNEINLQTQLQSSFFDGNSPSIKKTVDFIADRIASNYVKILRKRMPNIRSELVTEGLFEEQAAIICRNKMIEDLVTFSQDNCNSAVSLLIGDSLSLAALKMCQGIASRMTAEKVNEWIHNHIKPEIFPEIPVPDLKEVKTDLKTITTSQQNSIEDGEFRVAFSSIILLHRVQKQLHQLQPVSLDTIDQILNAEHLASCSGLISTLVDFGIALIAFTPHYLTSERQEKLISLWREQWNSDCHLLCPRNIMILRDSPKDSITTSWDKLAELLVRLIKMDIVEISKVEEDCFHIIRQDLCPQQSEFVSQLLKRIVATSSNQQGRCDSGDVIDWIAWYCSNDHGGEF